MKQSPIKFVEGNVPDHLRVVVTHLYPGKVSNNQLKRIGHTKPKYVTLARLKDGNDNIVAEGKAACSVLDNPSRKVGRAVAVGRALAEYYSQ